MNRTNSSTSRIIVLVLFQILFAILIGWSICGILTYAGALTSDPNNKQYKTRTDFGADTIERAPWLTMPYPGEFNTIQNEHHG